MKVVVVISANAEWQVVRELFPTLVLENSPYGNTAQITLEDVPIKLFHSGWGKIASAGAMQYIIDHEHPDLIVNLGTCGGMAGITQRDEIILVTGTFVYDIVEMMGDPHAMEYYASSLNLDWLTEPYPFPVCKGVLASADSDLPPQKINELNALGAIAADWETGALAWVAQRNKVRLLILRGITDVVSTTAGEAYDNFFLFEERTQQVMKTLFHQLPAWLRAVQC